MNTITPHATGAFDRQAILAKLPEMRENNHPEYWNTVNALQITSSEDIDTMLGRPLVKIKDGEITFKYKSILSNEVEEHTRTSNARTLANELNNVIEHIQNQPNDAFDKTIDEMQNWKLRQFIMTLKVIGNHEDLVETLIPKIESADDFVMEALDRQRHWMDNEYDLMDQKIIHGIEDLVSAYVLQTIPKRNPESTKLYENDTDFIDAIEFARQHFISAEAIEHIILNAPMPESTIDLHVESLNVLSNDILSDTEKSEFLLQTRQNFTSLTQEEKHNFGQEFLNLLCASYGVHPPPVLEKEYEQNHSGTHQPHEITEIIDEGPFRRLDYTEEKVAQNMSKPMGRISVSEKDAENFSSFISTLSHEFVHSLEDFAAYSLNPKFTELLSANEEKTPSATPETQQKLQSIGLLSAFNSSSLASKRLFGQKNGGEYISSTDDKIKYREQIRERHAYLIEGFIEQSINTVADRVEKSKDPMHMYIKAQNTSFAVKEMRALIPDHIRTLEQYQKTNEDYDSYIQTAYDRALPKEDRLYAFKSAFDLEKAVLRKIIINGHIENSEDKTKLSHHVCTLQSITEDLKLSIDFIDKDLGFCDHKPSSSQELTSE